MIPMKKISDLIEFLEEPSRTPYAAAVPWICQYRRFLKDLSTIMHKDDLPILVAGKPATFEMPFPLNGFIRQCRLGDVFFWSFENDGCSGGMPIADLTESMEILRQPSDVDMIFV